MFLRLLLLLTIVPFVELVILLRLAEWLRWDGTIALVLLTGFLGAWLARREGLKAMARVQSDLQSGVMPARSVVDGLLILVAGIVLVTPGVLTDVCGFALLVPPIRRWVAGRLARMFERRTVTMHYGENDEFIDVQYTPVEPTRGEDQLD